MSNSINIAPYPLTPGFQQWFSPPACVAAWTGGTILQLGMIRPNSISIRKRILAGSKGGSGRGLILGVFEPDFDVLDAMSRGLEH